MKETKEDGEGKRWGMGGGRKRRVGKGSGGGRAGKRGGRRTVEMF